MGLCPDNWEWFDRVGPKKVDRILGNVSIAICALNPWFPPPKLAKASWEVTWVGAVDGKCYFEGGGGVPDH